MKRAYILHGVCDEAEFRDETMARLPVAHWFPWLKEWFEVSGVACVCPEMPVPYAPHYEDWRAVWERLPVDAETVVVGHSAGAGFILKWLGENPDVRLAKLVLVAPWRDPERTMGDFMQGPLDAGIIGQVGAMHVLVSGDDEADVLKSAAEIERVYPAAKVHRFEGMGHFCVGDIGVEFPELWEICRE